MENLFDKLLIDLTDEEMWEYVPDMKDLRSEGMTVDDAWDFIDSTCEEMGIKLHETTLRDYSMKYNSNYAYRLPPPPKLEVKKKDKDDFNYLKTKMWKLRPKDDTVVLKLRVENDKLRKENERLKKMLKEQLANEVENRINYKRFMETYDSLGGEGNEFVEDHELSPLEIHMQSVRNYNQWKESNSKESQKELVKERWMEFLNDPLKNSFEFTGLTNEGRKAAFPLLKKWLNNVIGKMNAHKRFDLRFRVNGQWHTAKLTPEKWRELNEKFSEESLLYSIEKDFDNYVSDPAITELPDWSMFDAIGLKEVKNVGSNEVGGSFFKFLNRTDVDLSRYQIFSDLGETVIDKNGKEHFRQRKELNDCCFVYALKMSGKFSEDELNTIRLRIRNRNLSQTAVRAICEEFGIKAKIRQFKGLPIED